MPAEIVFLQKRTVSLLMRQEAVPLNDINNSSTVHHLGHCDLGGLFFGGYVKTFVKELQRCLAGYGKGKKKKKKKNPVSKHVEDLLMIVLLDGAGHITHD